MSLPKFDSFVKVSLSSKQFSIFFGTFLLYFSFYRGVMVIVVGNGHGDTSSNPR